jgi:hypothetical protein
MRPSSRGGCRGLRTESCRCFARVQFCGAGGDKGAHCLMVNPEPWRATSAAPAPPRCAGMISAPVSAASSSMRRRLCAAWCWSSLRQVSCPGARNCSGAWMRSPTKKARSVPERSLSTADPGVPGGGLEGQPRRDGMVAVLPQDGLTGAVDREHTVVERSFPVGGIAEVCLPTVAVVRVPVVEVRLAHQVTSVGEGRYPLALAQAGVPSDMVGVQVGIDDCVHIFGLDSEGGELVQEVAPAVGQQPEVAGLVVAQARVYQDGAALPAQHPGLHVGQVVPGLAVEEVRTEPGLLGVPRLCRDGGEQHADRGEAAVPLGDAADFEGAEGKGLHDFDHRNEQRDAQ